SAAGSRQYKSTAAALAEDENAGEISRPAATGSRTGDAGGDRLTSFRLTDIGEGIMEVEVLQWFVRPGDRVNQFDKLCEVQSDKANVEITSRYDGVVRNVHWSVGDMVQTGSVLVDIEEAADSAEAASSSPSKQPFLYSAEDEGVPELSVPRSPDPPPAAAAAAAVETPLPSKVVGESEQGRELVGEGVGGNGRGRSRRTQMLATPAVRRLCREMSVDPSWEPIPGTGRGGRVLKGDVLAYVAARAGAADRSSAGPPNLPGERGGWQPGDLRKPWPSLYRRGKTETGKASDVREMKQPVPVPIKGVQRAMMEAMQRALEVPHMTFCDEVNADRLGQLRADLKAASERRGVRLSYLPLIVKATSMALTAFPALNASLSEDKKFMLQHPSHNIGVAMDTAKGLLVPKISAVEEMSVLDIAE
ncbi:unnamed protein product, partial [Hapterophycus canaliculatus]